MKKSSKIISKYLSKHPIARGFYAVLSGQYQGACICYIEEESKGDTLAFMIMSPTEAIYLSKQEIKEGIREGTIELVQRLPINVYEVVLANYRYERQRHGG